MYIIRDIFRTKPGKAKELASIFKKAYPLMKSPGIKDFRILTDSVAAYWTVVLEFGVDDIRDYFDFVEGRRSNKELNDTMKGYMDLVVEGHREILKVE